MLKPFGGYMDQKFTTKKLENQLMRPHKLSLNKGRLKAKKAPKGKK